MFYNNDHESICFIMMIDFNMNYTINKHIPVMINELIQSLKIKENGTYIDSTFGMGGHSTEILKRLGRNGFLYSFDKDPDSVSIGKNIIDPRFRISNQPFSKLLYYSEQKKILGKVNGIIFDLGVSSLQIDNNVRGFSYKKNGPLDMRMNPNTGISAADWLFKNNADKIAYVLKNFGEERFAKKIAYAIKKKNKITSTLELVDVIQKAIPKKNKFKHPAKRTFQAIRIYINQELDEIKKGLENTLKILKPGGRLSVISFHSLEDRIVKKFMVKNSQKAFVPHGLPITEKQIQALTSCKLQLIHRAFPSLSEIKNNPRARSAILRTAEIKNKI